jgi:phosphatidylserine decarboxylase
LIAAMKYCPGKFVAAMRECASTENEQNVISLSTSAGEMVFKQIAGLIARRIVCWKKPGDQVERGERVGLVRFGSRADLWVPRGAKILVAVGQNVKGGSSFVSRWPALAHSNEAGTKRSVATEENLAPAGRRT